MVAISRDWSGASGCEGCGLLLGPAGEEVLQGEWVLTSLLPAAASNLGFGQKGMGNRRTLD